MANHGLKLWLVCPLRLSSTFMPFVNRLAVELRFGGPPAAEIAELVAVARRQVPGGRLRALHRQRAAPVPLRMVAWRRRMPVFRIHAVMEGHFDGVADVSAA